MRDELVTPDDFPIEDASLVPQNPDFYRMKSEIEAESRQELAEKAAEGGNLFVGDSDLDGLAAATVWTHVHPETTFIEAGPHSNSPVYLSEVFETIGEYATGDETVVVADICIEDMRDFDSMEIMADNVGEIIVCDHHQWESDHLIRAKEVADTVVIDDGEDIAADMCGTDRECLEAYYRVRGHDEDFAIRHAEKVSHLDNCYDRCGAQIVRDVLVDRGTEISEEINQLVEIAGVYDLWQRDENGRFVDGRANSLNDYLDVADPEESIATLLATGPNVLSVDGVQAKIEEKREREQQLVEKVVSDERVDWYEIEFDGQILSCALTYGSGPSNKIAQTLKEEKGAHVVILVKPHGGMSLRASDPFDECHLIARELNGGGNNQTAGGFVIDPETILDYAEHWTTEGKEAKKRIVETLDELGYLP